MLKLVNGETIEQSIDKNVIVIGRSAKCDVVVPQDGMSRQHCQIDVVGGEIFVTDLGSTNGVLIDGVKIEPHMKTPYQTFLQLSFGAVQSLQLEADEPTGFNREAAHAHAAAHAGGAERSNANLTRTRQMKPEDKTPAPQAAAGTKFKPKVQEGTTKAQTMMVNIVVVLILLGAVYWYMTKEDGPTESSVPVIEETQTQPEAAPAPKPYESF